MVSGSKRLGPPNLGKMLAPSSLWGEPRPTEWRHRSEARQYRGRKPLWTLSPCARNSSNPSLFATNVCGGNYTVTNIWYLCQLSMTYSSYKKRILSEALRILFCKSYCIKSWDVNCFHNLFIISPLGFVLLTKVDTFLLLFSAMDFQVLLLSKKIIAFSGILEKNHSKYFIIEYKT